MAWFFRALHGFDGAFCVCSVCYHLVGLKGSGAKILTVITLLMYNVARLQDPKTTESCILHGLLQRLHVSSAVMLPTADANCLEVDVLGHEGMAILLLPRAPCWQSLC